MLFQLSPETDFIENLTVRLPAETVYPVVSYLSTLN